MLTARNAYRDCQARKIPILDDGLYLIVVGW